ncbi:MAG TPA: tetratricopeptide repeat protein [Chryseolinea sp.]|nr:tetratricopeptide repeat protein [Chryseolinea sp.]
MKLFLLLLHLCIISSYVQSQTRGETTASFFFENGEKLLNQGAYPEALEQFNKCLQQSPAYSEAYLNRAYAKQQLNDNEGANIDLSIYLEQKPDQPEALFARATLRYQLKKYAEAKEDLLKVLTLPAGETNTVYFKKPASSTSGITEVITTQSGFRPQIYNYLGLVDTELKKYPSAIVWLDSAIALDPNQPDYYVNRGVAKEAFDDGTAVADYKKALTIKPDHAIALKNLSMHSRKQGNLTDADDQLERAIESDSSMLYPYLERAYQRMEAGYYKGAEEDYSSALKVTETDPEIWFNRGLAREKLKNWAGAYADYTKVIELNEKLEKAWLGRGNVLMKQSKYKEAIEDYTVAITYQPDYALAFYNRALAKNKLKLNSEACADLSQAMKLGLQIEPKLKAKICGE